MLLCISMGCYENIDNTPEPEVVIQTSEVYVTTRLSGRVINQDDEIISDYYLNINGTNQDVPSDYFLVELEEARKKGQTIRVNKDGNQIGLRTELLIENDINHLQIITHDVYNTAVKTQANATVQINKELTVDFTSATFESGYTGDVHLEYIYIDPKIALTPVGYDYESHLLAVDSKGGFYITASNDSGATLAIDPTSSVILKIGDLENDVNGLFELNEETDIWELIGEVSADSEIEISAKGYYTFAYFTKGVFVEGTITKDESAVAYQPMRWSHSGLQNEICATENGRWIGLLPEKDVVEIELLNPCDESLQYEKITINNEDLDNQIVAITNTESYQYLNTTVIDCEGNALSNATLNITSNNIDNHFIFSEEGQNRWITVCNEFSIAAVDNDSQEQGTEIEWSPQLNETIDFLSTCPEYADGFSYLKIREDEQVYTAFSIETENNKTILSSENGEIKIIFKGDMTGQYQNKDVNIVINDSNFGVTGYFIQCENSEEGCGIQDFKVTHYSTEQNGQVRVEFYGNLWMQTLNPLNAGTYPVKGVIISRV